MKDNKPQVLVIDQETAKTLRSVSAKSNVSPRDLVKAATQIMSYAMGRKLLIEGKNKVLEIDSLEKFDTVIDLD